MTQWWKARSTVSSCSLWWTSLLCVGAFLSLVLSEDLQQRLPLLCLHTVALIAKTKPRSRKRLQLVKDSQAEPRCGLCAYCTCVLWRDFERNWQITATAPLSRVLAFLEISGNKLKAIMSAEWLRASCRHWIRIFYWPAWINVTYYCGCTALSSKHHKTFLPTCICKISP